MQLLEITLQVLQCDTHVPHVLIPLKNTFGVGQEFTQLPLYAKYGLLQVVQLLIVPMHVLHEVLHTWQDPEVEFPTAVPAGHIWQNEADVHFRHGEVHTAQTTGFCVVSGYIPYGHYIRHFWSLPEVIFKYL